MIYITPSNLRRAGRALIIMCAVALSPVVQSPAAQALEAGQRAYATPDEAATALVNAIRAGDRKELLAILGTSADRLISSGDPVQDKKASTDFLAAYDAKHSLTMRGQGEADLVVGANDWPLPIPIVQSAGKWSFDSSSGAQELINRRVGRNELLTIRTLLAGIEAQKDYFERFKAGTGAGAYAQRVLSTEGQTDGLFWEVEQGQPPSPLGPLVEQAREDGYPGSVGPGGKPMPYHGYFFRILKAQGPNGPGGAKDYVHNGQMTGGFAFLAWPASYGNSGVVSFIAGPDGTIYQKDLGPNTPRAAAAITRFDPDLSWVRVDIVE